MNPIPTFTLYVNPYGRLMFRTPSQLFEIMGFTSYGDWSFRKIADI